MANPRGSDSDCNQQQQQQQQQHHQHQQHQQHQQQHHQRQNNQQHQRQHHQHQQHQQHPQQHRDNNNNNNNNYNNKDHSQDRRSNSNNNNTNANNSNSNNNNAPDNRYAGPGAGAVKFIPGAPTIDLPLIETKVAEKKFTGRCRLFVANLPTSITEKNLRELFEPHGEIGEVFLEPRKTYAFIKMDTRQSAESARTALDCMLYEGRTLNVRLAAHAAAIRVKNLSPQVTNELLAYAFRYFGEIERAVIITNDKGKSTGEGIVEYSRKTSAMYAIKRCQQESFMLTNNPKPVLVEPMDQRDEDDGFSEKKINKNTKEFHQERGIGPRFAEQGSFEYAFAVRWKNLYEIEKQKRERLEAEIQEARRMLQEQVECSKLEHETLNLRAQLKQMEDDKQRYTQLQEKHMAEEQQREEQRRHEDMMIRQREDEILRRQQMGENIGIHESELGMQANALQDLLDRQERESGIRQVMGNEQPSANQQMPQHQGPPFEMDPLNVNRPVVGQHNQVNHQHQGQPFDIQSVIVNQQGVGQQHNQVNHQPPGNPFGFLPQQFGPPMAMSINPNYVAPPPPQAMGVMSPAGQVRPQRFNRPFNGDNGGGAAKRKRFRR